MPPSAENKSAVPMPEGERHVVQRPALNGQRRELLICFLFLAFLSGLTRFTGLNLPHSVVFDEVHFGKFVTSYCCRHDHFFDIHPPHAKLIIAAFGATFGYKGDFDFDHIGEEFGDSDVPPLRVWPAIAGAALPLVIFILLLQLGCRLPMATMGGLALVLDNAMILQSRHILLDSTLLLATFGTISAYLAARTRAGWGSIGYGVVCGLAAGLAFGTKFTGGAASFLVGLLGLLDLLRARHDKNALKVWGIRVAVIVGTASVFYIAGWYLHWMLLSKPGGGDAFMKPTGNFIADTIKMHQVMLEVNYGLNFTHPDASPWWSWPFMLKPPLYWSGTNAMLILLGNPVVWWSAALLFLAAAFYGLRRLDWGKKRGMHANGILICVWGFAIAFFPLARVPRVLFLYHYFTPLLFTIMAACLWIDQTKVGASMQALKPNKWQWGMLAAMVIGFIIVSPLTYGFSGPDGYLSLVLKILPLR